MFITAAAVALLVCARIDAMIDSVRLVRASFVPVAVAQSSGSSIATSVYAVQTRSVVSVGATFSTKPVPHDARTDVQRRLLVMVHGCVSNVTPISHARLHAEQIRSDVPLHIATAYASAGHFVALQGEQIRLLVDVHACDAKVMPSTHGPLQTLHMRSLVEEHDTVVNWPAGHERAQGEHSRSAVTLQAAEKNEPDAQVAVEHGEHTRLEVLVQAVVSNDTPFRHGALQLAQARFCVAAQADATNWPAGQLPVQGLQTRSAVALHGAEKYDPGAQPLLLLHALHARLLDVVHGAVSNETPAGHAA